MRTARLFVLLPAIATLLSGCSAGNTTAESASRVPSRYLTGDYRYLAYDSGGALLLTGRLTLIQQSDSTLGGNWTIRWAPGADREAHVGPQVGTGALMGARTGQGWWLTLTPGWADNNVDLAAVSQGDTLAGRWEHSTIAGPFGGGSFRAWRE